MRCSESCSSFKLEGRQQPPGADVMVVVGEGRGGVGLCFLQPSRLGSEENLLVLRA